MHEREQPIPSSSTIRLHDLKMASVIKKNIVEGNSDFVIRELEQLYEQKEAQTKKQSSRPELTIFDELSKYNPIQLAVTAGLASMTSSAGRTKIPSTNTINKIKQHPQANKILALAFQKALTGELITKKNLSTGSDYEKIIDILLDVGINPDETDALGRTALMRVAQVGWLNAANLLVKPELHNHIKKPHYAKLDRVDNDGRTALIHAVINGQEEIVTLLLEREKQLGMKQTSPEGDFEQPSTYVLNEPDSLGCTALMYAIKGHYETIANLLLDAGANPINDDTHNRNSFMILADVLSQKLTDNTTLKTSIYDQTLLDFADRIFKKMLTNIPSKKDLKIALETKDNIQGKTAFTLLPTSIRTSFIYLENAQKAIDTLGLNRLK